MNPLSPSKFLLPLLSASHRALAPNPTIRTMSALPPSLAISASSDPTALKAALPPLLRSTGGSWALSPAANGLERDFKFKTFKRTWEFMNAVAAEAARVKHHPEWSNVS